jgi:hypothetical protein
VSFSALCRPLLTRILAYGDEAREVLGRGSHERGALANAEDARLDRSYVFYIPQDTTIWCFGARRPHNTTVTDARMAVLLVPFANPLLTSRANGHGAARCM